MALASFFSKSALSASQILSGVSQDEFIRRIENTRVSIVFSEDASSSAEGRVALEFLVNLLARLLPALGLEGLDKSAQVFLPDLERLAVSINPLIEITSGAESTFVVVVGEAEWNRSGEKLYLGSEGWIARLSRKNPQSFGQSGIPFGAAAAACIASANVFRFIFRDALPEADLDGEIDFSLWDYDAPRSEAPCGPFSIGEVHLAGAGAIGNGLMWTLARLPTVNGTIHVVDPEKIDLGNLQRYVLTTHDSLRQLKTQLAEKAFANTSVKIESHPTTWGAYLTERGNYNINTIAVALDSARSRIEVQGSLPKRIFNAWTQRENLGISRHLDFLNKPCLACLYFPDGEQPHEDAEIARSLKMLGPEALMEIRVLLHTGAALSPEFVERVAALAGKDPSALASFVGQPLRSLYSGAVCGGLLLDFSGPGSSTAEVPMPFQSGLAGVMLAAELVAAEFELPRPTTTTLNLLRPFPPYLSFSREKLSGCVCADGDFCKIYDSKWNQPPIR